MYDEFILKMKDYFSKEGLIIYSKSCEFYKINKITFDDIKMYFELLGSQETLPSYISKPNHLACCIYYLSKRDQKYIKIMYQKIILKLKTTDEINDTNLMLIYNIIEFAETFLTSTLDKQKTEYLLKYLERFSPVRKTFENFLLYKHYHALLLFRVNQNEVAYREYLEIVASLADETGKKTKFMEFIQLRNDLFNLRLENTQLNEQCQSLKDLFMRVENLNHNLEIKLGFGLYKNLYQQNKYSECAEILEKMMVILKKSLMSGITMKNGLDFYFAILSRLGFIGVLLGNKKIVENAIRKTKKSLAIIKDDKQNKKVMILFKAYSFVDNLLELNSSIYVEDKKKLAEQFISDFMPNNIEQIKPENFILRDVNVYECVINLNALNKDNYNMSSASNKIIEKCLSNIGSGIPIQHSMVITFIIGVQNYIYNLSQSFCSEENKITQKETAKKIIRYGGKVFDYAKNNFENEPLLKTDFIKNSIIKIYSSCTHCFIYEKDFKALKKSILFFDDLCKYLKITMNTPGFELVLKIKGDFWFSSNDFVASIDFYLKAAELMSNDDPKKGSVLFNLGCSYYFSGDKKGAFDNLNKAINAFGVLGNEKGNYYEFYKKNYENKVTTAKNIIKLLDDN